MKPPGTNARKNRQFSLAKHPVGTWGWDAEKLLVLLKTGQASVRSWQRSF